MPRARLGSAGEKPFLYELHSLTRHAAVLGSTGSGKTVLCKVLVEECLLRGIPVLALDPKGDIGSLAVTAQDFDFRPFAKKREAARAARTYRAAHPAAKEQLRRLGAVQTTIFTPKNAAGVQVSLFPDLRAPRLALESPEGAAFVETVSGSLLELAGVRATEKVLSYLSTILLASWGAGRDVSLEELVTLIVTPPFQDIGSLPVDEYLSLPERRRLAAQLSVLLTSPGKQLWRRGERLDVGALLQGPRLSVFDLRAVQGVEKQFVVERILQELYRFLVRRRGSERLRFVLYIDELAGLVPPPPSNPPCKRILELLLRQARAFGLGIIVATQSPGDIDYRLLGNLGTRFIGRLRTQRDIEKVAVAAGLAPARLREEITGLSTGEFLVHDAVRNATRVLQARWLYSFHRGPLSAKEIAWVNNPGSRPEPRGTLVTQPRTRSRQSGRSPASPRQSRVAAEEFLKVAPRKRGAKGRVRKRATSQKRGRSSRASPSRASSASVRDSALAELVREVKRYSDSTQIRVAMSEHETFAPHLRLVVEPLRKDLGLELQGPFVFDLTAKLIPLGDYLKHYAWRRTVPRSLRLIPVRRSLRQAFTYAVREARQALATRYFESTLTGKCSRDRDLLEEQNRRFLTAEVSQACHKIDRDAARVLSRLQKALRETREKERSLGRRLLQARAGRVVRRALRQPAQAGAQERRWEVRRAALRREMARLKKEVERERTRRTAQKERVSSQARRRAARAIRERSFRPTRDDLHVYASILLIPAKA